MTAETMFGGSAVVAVVRTDDDVRAADIARAVVAGGIGAVEITATVPGAAQLVAALRSELEGVATIGAGTVLTAAQADEFAGVGAAFMMSPALNHDVIAVAHAAGIPFLPGVLTPTEAWTAASLGVAAVKLFPAGSVGTGHLRALREVLPDIAFVPTGGIEPDDVAGWLDAGAVAVGVGGAFARAHRRGGYEAVLEVATQLIRSSHVHKGEAT